MRNNFLVLALLLALTACGDKRLQAPEPIIETQEVVVPGEPVACVPKDLGPRPDYPDSDSALAKAADAAVRYALLWAGREQRINREQELETVIDGCPKEE